MEIVKNKIEGQEEKSLIMIFEQSFPGQIKFTGKILGQGGFSKIYDVLLNGSITGAGKFIKQKENQDKKDEIYFSVSLKGKNVIRQHAVFQAMHGNDTYYLVVMEKANLSDLSRLTEYIK